MLLCPKRSRRHCFKQIGNTQELRTLRETREGLDDQIDRLEWAIHHGTPDGRPPPTSSCASEEDDAADEELLEVGLSEAGSPLSSASGQDATAGHDRWQFCKT